MWVDNEILVGGHFSTSSCGSFSAISTPIFATKTACFIVFQVLPIMCLSLYGDRGHVLGFLGFLCFLGFNGFLGFLGFRGFLGLVGLVGCLGFRSFLGFLGHAASWPDKKQCASAAGPVGSYWLKSDFHLVSVGTPIWHSRRCQGLMGR